MWSLPPKHADRSASATPLQWSIQSISSWLLLCLLAIVVSGCGPGEETYHLSGKVSFQGKPIPEGYIVFEPDADRGNSGPAGRSKIFDGRYDTRSDGGRATVGGPHVVRIVGLDAKIGPPGMDELALPKPLFKPQLLLRELPTEHASLDFDIPAS